MIGVSRLPVLIDFFCSGYALIVRYTHKSKLAKAAESTAQLYADTAESATWHLHIQCHIPIVCEAMAIGPTCSWHLYSIHSLYCQWLHAIGRSV